MRVIEQVQYHVHTSIMKRPVASPAGDFAFHCREPVDRRPEHVKHVGINIAQKRSNIGGHVCRQEVTANDGRSQQVVA